MRTIATVQVTFNDPGCAILRPSATEFGLRDDAGNQVTIQLRDILRCLSIAEHDKLVGPLSAEFWASAQQHK
jgi:hypothetical protein